MRVSYYGMLGRVGESSASSISSTCLSIPKASLWEYLILAQRSIRSVAKALVLMSRKSKTFYSKKYGIGLIRFTHRSGNILHTSTKGDHAVRYHSMHDNKYLSYFRGHENTLVRHLQ
jgi:hypothetical protein